MAYTQQEKLDFLIKDKKYEIGVSLGNAFNKSVDIAISEKLGGEKLLERIFELRDKFFEENQLKSQQEFDKWLAENDEKLKIQFGIPTETINQGIDI